MSNPDSSPETKKRGASPSCRRIALAFLALALAASATGCGLAEERTADGVSVTYPIWQVYLIAGIGLAGIVAGLVVGSRKSLGDHRKFGYVASVVVLLVALLLAPTIALSRVDVDSQGFSIRVGFWFTQKRQEYLFDEIKEMHTGTEEFKLHGKMAGKRGQQPFLTLIMKSGLLVRVTVGDLVKGALTDIVNNAEASGVKILRMDTTLD